MNEQVRPTILESGIRWLWIAALTLIADQLTKIWIQLNVVVNQEYIALLPFLNIHHTGNPGAAFSFCADCGGAQRWAFSVLAVVVSIVLVVWLRRLPLANHKLLTVGLALIVGGALGNMIDRVYLGHVVDFIQVYRGNWKFPSFNVADSAISIGAALVILDSLREMQRERRERRAGKVTGQ